MRERPSAPETAVGAHKNTNNSCRWHSNGALKAIKERWSQVITIEFSFHVTPSVRGQSLICLYCHLTKLDALQLVQPTWEHRNHRSNTEATIKVIVLINKQGHSLQLFLLYISNGYTVAEHYQKKRLSILYVCATKNAGSFSRYIPELHYFWGDLDSSKSIVRCRHSNGKMLSYYPLPSRPVSQCLKVFPNRLTW